MTGGSVQARDISQSVVVTGSGNNVRLIFGDSGMVLPLQRRQLRRPVTLSCSRSLVRA